MPSTIQAVRERRWRSASLTRRVLTAEQAAAYEPRRVLAGKDNWNPIGEESMAKFGTTVVIPSGLRGEIYHVSRLTKKLPDFRAGNRRGAIYTSSLDIPPQDFAQGFPGVTRKFEWFAIDYRGRFWIDKPGAYTFELTSDDGSRLYVDDEVVIDNDGLHPAETVTGEVTLPAGVHKLRVSYFQGPRFHVALVLRVAGVGEKLRVFSTEEFKPPAEWK